jgi:hypothetical protein
MRLSTLSALRNALSLIIMFPLQWPPYMSGSKFEIWCSLKLGAWSVVLEGRELLCCG